MSLKKCSAALKDMVRFPEAGVIGQQKSNAASIRGDMGNGGDAIKHHETSQEHKLWANGESMLRLPGSVLYNAHNLTLSKNRMANKIAGQCKHT